MDESQVSFSRAGAAALEVRLAGAWRLRGGLLSGYVPDYLYDLGRIDTKMPFAELEKLSHVNARAHAAGKDPAFSQRIREGLPKPAPLG